VSKDINDMARDAIKMTSDPGFGRCTVESAEGRILAFEFDTTDHARRFCSRSSNRRIVKDRQTTVLATMP